ncbi:hypothetical protein SDRG_09305 [Saprolegnia diclina VS20]|uniref:Uncharacterized protein n=1 Tax=Saprolegnia diclina (strain VS20) TaxID=1156394 RepID=T0RSW2_SAPDV|nr:hypothetical protein SDRG_09305 [Saprolegnia diclina VS20]EQC33327.1 hypothetical protein SDRG_09305 [Saprolegnia diclina VS20]|eukprot:XP_008613450.1 hypothetical protein SDRG_09305 [Saprolegnia diclina VS20]
MTPPTGLFTASPKVACSYKSRRCSDPRALKRNGQMPTLCEFHRARQNTHQRKRIASSRSHGSRNAHRDTRLLCFHLSRSSRPSK